MIDIYSMPDIFNLSYSFRIYPKFTPFLYGFIYLYYVFFLTINGYTKNYNSKKVRRVQ